MEISNFLSVVSIICCFLLRGILSQCEGTWQIDGLKGYAKKKFENCTREGPVRLVWRTTGDLGDDEYFVRLRENSANYDFYKGGQYSGKQHGVSEEEGPEGGNFHVSFDCNLEGSLFHVGTCDAGLFHWKIIDCGCPTNWTEAEPCVYENGVGDAKDAVCVKPPPPSKPYLFMYSVRDFIFEQIDPSNVQTEKISTSSNGIIKNCANGVTTDNDVDMSLTIENSQSMTVSKSFTSSQTSALTAGTSVTVAAEANAIFAKASVAATASFEYSNSWMESATEEESKTLQTASEIGFRLSTKVSVDPNTCTLYTLSTQVSSEPMQVPYTANTYLTVLHNDQDRKQVTDINTLETIQDLMTEYNVSIDTSTNTLVYPIEGEFSGHYATEADTETSNCNECGAVSSMLSASASKPTYVLSFTALCLMGVLMF